MSYDVTLTPEGMLPLPAELIRQMGLKPGDPVSMDAAGDHWVVRPSTTRERATARLRAAMAGYSVQHFLQERAGDAGE